MAGDIPLKRIDRDSVAAAAAENDKFDFLKFFSHYFLKIFMFVIFLKTLKQRCFNCGDVLLQSPDAEKKRPHQIDLDENSKSCLKIVF